MIVVIADSDPGFIRELLVFYFEMTINCQTHTLIDPIRRLDSEVRTPLGQ
jgi:hypothetical protein